MDDLSDLLHDAGALTASFDVAAVGRRVAARRRRHHLRIGVACVVVVSVAAAGLSFGRRATDDRADIIAGPPGTTAPASATVGSTRPVPPVPAGWRVMDLADLRFAVPAGWEACQIPDGTAEHLQIAATPGFRCDEQAPSGGSLTVQGGQPAGIGGAAVAVGDLSAVPVALSCAMCRGYRFDDGFVVTVSGPDADRILSTFTSSGRTRALEDGPTLDTADWRTVELGGVALRVPPSWPTIDLSTIYAPDGSRRGPTPDDMPGLGFCGSGLFAPQPPAVVLGSAPVPMCGAGMLASLGPGDGVWLEVGSTATPLSAPATTILQNGLVLHVQNADVSTAHRPAVVVSVATGDATVQIIIGAGLDPALARTILRSIRPT